LLGQFEQALDHWQKVIANLSKQGDFQKVGRLLTELAQTYSQLGQNREAICRRRQRFAIALY
jgi:tetratricopeptide (TPR) repeat protein